MANLILQADKKPVPVEMGAVWSVPEVNEAPAKGRKTARQADKVGAEEALSQPDGMHGGRFLIDTSAPSNTPQQSDALRSFPDRTPKHPDTPQSDVADVSSTLPARFREVLR